jgi:hypothetical protein
LNAQAEPRGDRLDEASADLALALDRARNMLRERDYHFTPAELIQAASVMLESSQRVAIIDGLTELTTLLHQLSTPTERVRLPGEPPKRALRFVRAVA